MPFARVIDLEHFLQPISAESPVGEDLRVDRSPTSLYYSLKDARNNARATERSSLFDDGVDLIKPWRTVVDLAPGILLTKSKDLEVACWFTEGLIRLHGAAGLRDGFRLIHGLISQFWQDLYPLPDEDGIDTRLAPLTGLNGDGGEGTLMAPIRNMAMTNAGDFGSFNLWQYQKARDNAKLTDDDERAKRVDALGFSLQDIEDTVRESSTDFYVDMIATLEETLADYKDFQSRLREQCGQQAPPSSNIASLLDEVLRTVRFLSREKLESLQRQANAAPSADADNQLDDHVFGATLNGFIPAPHAGPIGHREDALRRLQEVADYFRIHEPHTPLAPAIERLIRWGRMTVAELMMELLPEDTSRGFFSQLTGLRLDGSDTHKYAATITPAPAAAALSAVPAAAAPTKVAPAAEASVPPAEPGW